jgi:S1-C subfamily serine protease
MTDVGGRRDTLGLLVRDVVEGSPAAKAGLEEGVRLTSINGVSLRLSSADVDEPAMRGVLQRRLTRVVRELKPGADVELGVYADGRTRTIKLKAASLAEAPRERNRWDDARRDLEQRAVLGVSLGSEPSKRDTAGIFVQGVTPDGPAEKAGIVEGARIAAINGQDLRVSRDDAGDPAVAQAKVSRLQRVLRGLKAGDEVELRVVEGGRSRTLKVKTAKASELSNYKMPFVGVFSDDFDMALPMRAPMAPRAPRPPMVPDGVEMRREIERGLQSLPRRIEIRTGRGRVSI